MKLRHKIIASALPLVTVAPTMLTITSCNKNGFDNLINTMFHQVIDEFVKIAKIYRPTYGTEMISSYISQEVAQEGLACYDDYDEMLAHESEWEVRRPDGHQNGNLMIKIPATTGCEDWPIVGLQAHMDMVCDGFTGGPITLVQEGDMIHSKDWKTSIGADDGVGLATLLVIIKNRDNFIHGPIRCYITVDEEDGEGGAHWMQPEWLKDVKYFINVDDNTADSVCVNCAGVQQTKVCLPCDLVNLNDATYSATYKNHYILTLKGANGGSSGFALENNPIFPIKTGFKLLNSFLQKFESGNNPIVITSIVTDQTASNGGGSISQNITIEFSAKEHQYYAYNEILAMIREVYVKLLAQHPDEQDFKINFVKDTTEYPYRYGITPAQSTYLIQLFADSNLYGDISTSKGILTKCSNIGPIETSFDIMSEPTKINVDFETFGRCSINNELGINPDKTTLINELTSADNGMLYYYYQIIKNAVGKNETRTDGIELDDTETISDGWIQSAGWNPCWEGDTISKATDIYMDYARSKGATMTQFRAMGWCECAEFIDKVHTYYPAQEFQMSCIGPTIVEEHTKNGYVLISTIKSLVDRLVYTLTQLKD